MDPRTSLLIVTLIAYVAVCVVESSPTVVPIESSGAQGAAGPESPYKLPVRPSIIPPFVPKTADLDHIDDDHDGRVTSEEWRRAFMILLAIYDSDGDGALTVAELQAYNLTHPRPTTHLAPPPSKQRNLSVDFKGQLAREHDHVTRKKEQRQRDQLYVRDRNTPRHQHRQEQRMQGRRP